MGKIIKRRIEEMAMHLIEYRENIKEDAKTARGGKSADFDSNSLEN